MRPANPDHAHLSRKDRQVIAQKKYQSKNRELLAKRAKDRWHKIKSEDPEKYQKILMANRVKTKEWTKKNPEWAKRLFRERKITPETRANRTAYARRKRKEDIQWVLRGRLRSRLWWALKKKNAKKAHKTTTLLGCSVEFLASYVEKKFLPGMNWDNRNLWDIDHILPCSSFDLLDPEQQKKCFHYTNLQPLWRWDNRSKSDKIIIQHES